MHGEIKIQDQQSVASVPKKPGSKKPIKYILGILVLVFLVFFVVNNVSREMKTKEALQAALAGEPQATADTGTYVITGILSPVHSYNVSTKVAGQVTEVPVAKGEKVEVNRILAKQDPTDIKLASGQGSTTDELLQRLKMAYDSANDAHEKNKALFEAGAIPQSTLDQSAVQAENARLQYEGTSKYIMEQTGKTIIKSPGKGIVTSLNIQAGDYAAAGMSIANVTDTSQVILKGNVFESWLGKLALHTKVNVYIDTFGKTFEGTVSYISPVSISSGQMFPVEITLNNENGELRAGMTASATLKSETILLDSAKT